MPWDMKPTPEPHEPTCECFMCSDKRRSQPPKRAKDRFYAASRASNLARPRMWAHLRDVEGYDINSTWIDKALAGEKVDLAKLWLSITAEIDDCDFLVLYVEPEDFPLKGAFVEVGIALGKGKSVRIVAPGVTLDPENLNPLGSWAVHPLVSFHWTVQEAAKPFEELC